MGTLQDLLAGLTHRLTGEKKHVRGKKSLSRFPFQLSQKFDPWLRSLKYLILAIILLASTWAVYPPLWEICPARALFSFRLSTPLLISVLIVFVITSMVNRLFWCKYLCPLGAVLAIFNKIAPLRLVINQSSCTTCGRCDTVIRHTLRDKLLSKLIETSKLHKVFFRHGIYEVYHNYKSFPRPQASNLDPRHPYRPAADKTLSDPFCAIAQPCHLAVEFAV